MTWQSTDVPLQVRVELTHGYLQHVADEVGADVLHVKGKSVHPLLSEAGDPRNRLSVDVDVLVRPAHVGRLVARLEELQWQRVTGFAEGSAFGHAMNLRHHHLGLLDLHRRWPGFGLPPATAFDRLWEHRETQEIAHVSCPVPSLTDQRIVLLLHFARTGSERQADFVTSWVNAGPADRSAVRRRVGQLDAEVSFAAAVDELDEFRDRPDYVLWRHFSEGSVNRWDEWHGRWSAARGIREKGAVARGFLAVNPDLLREKVGGEPTRADYLRAYADRLVTAVGNLRQGVRRR
ncbi:nucleotidyltransferase family protein [Calidifontibacter terrae]